MWFADRTETGWAEERYLGPVVNSGKSQVYPTVTSDGTLYFQAVREDGYGKADVYRSRLIDGVYQPPENLGSMINSEHYEGDVFVAQDESYLIVSIYGREDGFGEGFENFGGDGHGFKAGGYGRNGSSLPEPVRYAAEAIEGLGLRTYRVLFEFDEAGLDGHGSR